MLVAACKPEQGLTICTAKKKKQDIIVKGWLIVIASHPQNCKKNN